VIPRDRNNNRDGLIGILHLRVMQRLEEQIRQLMPERTWIVLRREPAPTPITARVGTRQPHRRLRLAPKQACWTWQIQTSATTRGGLAYEFFRFVSGSATGRLQSISEIPVA